jgi:hypothetical protein
MVLKTFFFPLIFSSLDPQNNKLFDSGDSYFFLLFLGALCVRMADRSGGGGGAGSATRIMWGR